MTQRKETPSPQSIEHGYEVRDANPRWVLICGVGLAILIVSTIFLMRWTLSYLSQAQSMNDGPPVALREGRLPARGPSISEDPRERERMAVFRKKEDRRLNSYGKDPLTQAVHIPIERAMELALEQGFPTRQTGREPPAAAPANEQIQARTGG